MTPSGQHDSRVRVLTLNGFETVEGDVFTLLTALRFLPGAEFELHAISKPRGEVYKRLTQLPHLRLTPMELGGIEAAAPGRSGKPTQIADFTTAIARIVRYVQREKIDLLYSIDRGVAPQIAAVVARLTGRPFVLNAAYPFYPQNGRFARFVLRQADLIQVHSRYLYDHLRPYVPDPGRMVIIPNGLDIKHYDLATSPRPARELFGIADEERVVVMTGRLNKYKGQDDLVKAVPIVLQQHPDTHFLIAGRGSDEVKSLVEALILERNIGHRVRLIGYVPSIPELLAAADVVTMPSWEEPFGLVALEGMAMAKPVVSTRAGGVPEFLIDQEMGLLVTPRNPEELGAAISQLLADPERAKRMGTRGRQQVEAGYTVGHYIEQVTKLLHKAQTAHPGRASRPRSPVQTQR